MSQAKSNVQTLLDGIAESLKNKGRTGIGRDVPVAEPITRDEAEALIGLFATAKETGEHVSGVFFIQRGEEGFGLVSAGPVTTCLGRLMREEWPQDVPAIQLQSLSSITYGR